MKTNAPKVLTWWIALVLGGLGILANFVTIPVLSSLSFYLLLVAFLLLLLATYFKGL